MRPLAILIAGEPVPGAMAARGTFGEMIRSAVGEAWQGPWSELDARGELPDFERFSGLIISGSPANVPTREPWIVALERYLARAVAANVPIFGICFGHQLLGQALGGLVTRNPRGLEVGTVALEPLAQDPVLPGLRETRWVNMAHSDSVVTLPQGARVLARTAQDDHAAVYFGARAWGVQFHPEMDAEIIRHYVAARTDAKAEARTVAGGASAGEAERDTPEAQGLLQSFVLNAVES